MNFLFGLILGMFVIVGVAYVHDAAIKGPEAVRQTRAIVNWDAFDSEVKSVRDNAAASWDRLTGQREKD